MTSPTQRYSAEEIAKLKVLAEKAIAARERVKGYIAPKPADVVAFESACSPDAIIRLLSAAAEDAARLEQIEKWAKPRTGSFYDGAREEVQTILNGGPVSKWCASCKRWWPVGIFTTVCPRDH